MLQTHSVLYQVNLLLKLYKIGFYPLKMQEKKLKELSEESITGEWNAVFFFYN